MKRVFLYVAGLIAISGCQKNAILDGTEDVLQEKTSVSVELGKKLENPYSMENMKRAAQLLMSVSPESSGAQDSATLEPTHYYVRFLPADYEELALLDADTTLLYDPVPFGYENSPNMGYYHDPEIPADKISWLYAFVEIGYVFPQVHYEILEEIYRPSDDEDDLEVIAMKITDNLDHSLVGLDEQMSSNLSDRELLGLFSKRYKPSGVIRVDMTDDSNFSFNTTFVRYAKIYIKTFWWNDITETNGEGRYFVDRRYKDNTSVYLDNRNRTCYLTKTWTEHAGMWVRDQIGVGRDNAGFIIAKHQEDLWSKATINNAFVLYDEFAQANGLTRPVSVRSYILFNYSTSGAPMLNNKSLTSYSQHYPNIAASNNQGMQIKAARQQLITVTEIIDKLIGKTIGYDHYPDIVLGCKDGSGARRGTYRMYSLVFHEAAHYSHAKKLSQFYWANVQYQALYDPTNTSEDYGNGAQAYSPYTGVAEAWSHFIEYHMMPLRAPSYNHNRNMTAYAGTSTEARTIPYVTLAKWIPSGLFRDLIDTDANAIWLRNASGTTIHNDIDRASGFTISQLFALLTDDVRTIPQLKNKIITQYPHRNTNNEITNLFKYYGY